MTPRARWVLAAITVGIWLVVEGGRRGWTDDPEQAAQLARRVGAVLAIGVAGALDSAGSEVPDAAPQPRWRRHMAELMPAVVPLAAAWAILLWACLPGARPGVTSGLGLETGVLGLAAVAGAGMSRERSGQPASPATTSAAAGPILVFLLAPMLPAGAALITSAEGPDWVAAHLHWAALGGVLVLTITHLWSDPGRGNRRRRCADRHTGPAPKAVTTSDHSSHAIKRAKALRALRRTP